jgi:hypothetical protein
MYYLILGLDYIINAIGSRNGIIKMMGTKKKI